VVAAPSGNSKIFAPCLSFRLISLTANGMSPLLWRLIKTVRKASSTDPPPASFSLPVLKQKYPEKASENNPIEIAKMVADDDMTAALELPGVTLHRYFDIQNSYH
jgi:hypothetical protein